MTQDKQNRVIDWRLIADRWCNYSLQRKREMRWWWAQKHPSLAAIVSRLRARNRWCAFADRLASGDTDNRSSWARAWAQEHPELASSIKAISRELYYDRKLASNRRSYQKFREKRAAYLRAWKHENRGRVRHYHAKRRARIGPVSADVAEFYQLMHSRTDLVCHICNREIMAGDVTLDHIIPLARGGEHAIHNLAPAHSRCNSIKCDRPLHEVQAR